MFVHRVAELEQVQALIASEASDRTIAEITGVPRRTVADWRAGKGLARRPVDDRCPSTGVREWTAVPPESYSYLLGLYLGDGCISTGRRGVHRLRIFSDARHVGIVAACATAMETILPGKAAHRYRRHGSRCVEVSMWWKHWPCYFPQHGPGRKHLRPIALADWQAAIVRTQSEAFVRGLLHSDGCRFIARDMSNGREHMYVRYSFSNRSEDIKGLLCRSLDELGIGWTRAGSKEIAIARRGSVARLEAFVGPKY